MTRKKFLQDLGNAKDDPPAHATDIGRYDSDGISFTYWYQRGGIRQEVGLKLITTNVDDYPDGNSYMLFTDDVDVDTSITDTFAQIEAVICGSSVSTAIREISGGLHQALTSGHEEHPIGLSCSSQGPCDSDMDDFGIDGQDDDDDASFGLDDVSTTLYTTQPPGRAADKLGNRNVEAIKLDLRAAKDAGFKIGVHGNLSKAGIVCISIRVTKLGISDEAMQAWGLLRNQYLVLLIRFQRGYRFMVQIMEESSLSGSVEMRVGLSDTYKPGAEEAFAAFNQIEAGTTSYNASQSTQQDYLKESGSLKPLFIGSPLHDLLRDRFPKIIKFRQQFRLPWSGAERLFNDRQGTLHSDLSKDLASYREPDNTMSTRALPQIVMEDTLSKYEVSEASLPLVAMQFVLRHFVRCTEFCLVCHCRVEDTFEALKPYVCSNPLCLYQFLALGFGPATEWEILSQPCVVDLLISLCYSQARSSRVKEFPFGVNLKVPLLPHFKQVIKAPHLSRPYNINQQPAPASDKPLQEPVKVFGARFYPEQNILSPIPTSWTSSKQRVTIGDWVVLVPSSGSRPVVYHCRVSDARRLDFVLGTVILCGTDTASSPADTKIVNQSTSAMEVDCYLYDALFDDLPTQYRHHAITSLLDTLPSVADMRKSLMQQQRVHRDTNLNYLRKQCPQAALDLLRWIIASNRSCIMQVDEVASGHINTEKLKPSEDRVSGMDEWMQFRFAQGAPDKEQRFVDCVKTMSASKNYPTLFAWHGSPLYNWHSIIRQGLNFDEVHHGRANGNGVYMSPFVNTSIGYTSGGGHDWPNSTLKVSTVVSLQELVNAPNSFISRSPHFVVSEKDWIQTRYLFVKTAVRHSTGSAAKVVYQQDPLYTAKDTKNESVSIPITAISKSRRLGGSPHSVPKEKKRKTALQEWDDLNESDDGVSIATEEEDFKLLNEDTDVYDSDDVVMTDLDKVFDDFTNQPLKTALANNHRKRNFESRESFILDRSKTDFVPGSLDTAGIRFLDPPSYASVSATKALMRAFSETMKVQESVPLHDLGFYLDQNRMENMYQWIVELHSFDKTLPLAKDMKAAGTTSIVFEMLFTNDFPFSPPFVRVVKPRFLDPMSGGGGHITSGGAICMELLTSTGWSAVNSIESVLLQVRLAISERERPARLLRDQGGFQTAPYAVGEAIAAYKRFCQKHGWQAPKGLDSLQSG